MKIPVKITFSENLRKLLTEKRLSQADFARKINTTTTSVQRWLKGESLPNTDTIDSIADLLNVPPYLLFKPGGHGEGAPSKQDDRDFYAFIDELAVKHLSELDLRAYREQGGPKEFLRIMRANYEHPTYFGVSNWYLDIVDALAKYAAFDIYAKIRNRPKKSESESA